MQRVDRSDKRAGCASNLTRFVTLMTKRAVVTKRAATGYYRSLEPFLTFDLRWTGGCFHMGPCMATQALEAFRWQFAPMNVFHGYVSDEHSPVQTSIEQLSLIHI